MAPAFLDGNPCPRPAWEPGPPFIWDIKGLSPVINGWEPSWGQL